MLRRDLLGLLSVSAATGVDADQSAAARRAAFSRRATPGAGFVPDLEFPLRGATRRVVALQALSDDGVIRLADAGVVVVGVIARMAGTVGNYVLMHDLMVVVGMHVRDGPQPVEHNGNRGRYRDNPSGRSRRHSGRNMSARAQQSQTGGSGHQRVQVDVERRRAMDKLTVPRSRAMVRTGSGIRRSRCAPRTAAPDTCRG